MPRKVIESGKHVVVPGSDGSELMDELKPLHGIRLNSSLLLSGNLQQIGSMEWILYKPRWGGFYNTVLERHLHDLSVNTVVVCGATFPTALEQLSMRQANGISRLYWLKTLHQVSTTLHCKS